MYNPAGNRSMKSTPINDESDLERLHVFLAGLNPPLNLGDLEEQIQIPAIRSTLRLWQQGNEPVALAYVDSGNNLRYESTHGWRTTSLEQEILAWGIDCMRERNARTGHTDTLDASCRADDHAGLDFLNKNGFQLEDIRTLEYARSLVDPIPVFSIPPGFSLRCAAGEVEVHALVDLHRAAFGTDNMTVEERLAIMRAPSYIPELDLLLTTPLGELCAFCICSLSGDDSHTGFTDPIGVHRDYQKRGLGKAILGAGLLSLQQRGATTAKLGTSSHNLPMQRLAESLGFTCVSEKLWFSRSIDR